MSERGFGAPLELKVKIVKPKGVETIVFLKGIPIKILYKTDDNPFKNKKNKLTERQFKKRARIRRR